MTIKRRMAAELKKHVGAVHVRGRLSLLQRKISNILLLNAYDELPDREVFEHTIRLRTLAEVAGFDSNDHALLREALEALVDVKIKWNVLGHDGEEEWGVSSFLAQAVTRGGVCRYAYPPELRRKLFNPEIYARINLQVQERFGSAYALALYENCVRFRKVGTTGWIELERWRDLLGVEEGQYDPYKYLNRDVLKPAVEEVNAFSDIRLRMEAKRERRRVVALKFWVGEDPQLRLELGGAEGDRTRVLGEKALPDPRQMAPDPESLRGPLQRRLVAFGLSDAQALDAATEYEKERVTRNLDYVERELERGRTVRTVAAFTLDALRQDYARGGDAEVEQALRRKREGEEAERRERTAREAEAERERVAREEARRVGLREEAARAEVEREARLEGAWAELGERERERIERVAMERLRAEAEPVYAMYREQQERGAEADSVAARIALRSFRYDALEEMLSGGNAGEEGRAPVAGPS